MADYDKRLESFEDNYPGACDGRYVWMIDCKKLDDSDQDKNPGDTRLSPFSAQPSVRRLVPIPSSRVKTS